MWMTFNGNGLVTSNGTGWGYTPPVDPYNPYNLPDGTIRYKFDDASYDPSTDSHYVGGQWTQVSSSPNVWDWSITSDNPSLVGRFRYAFGGLAGPFHILGANLTGRGYQNGLYETWRECYLLDTVAMMDTRNVSDFQGAFAGSGIRHVAALPLSGRCFQMFSHCTSLVDIPRFENLGVQNCQEMFAGCINVTSGIIDSYDSLSAPIPSSHYQCYYNCGINNNTGAAELAQIPSDWK